MISLTIATQGLKLGDNTPEHTIECPHCEQSFDFNSDGLVWDDDGTFEFCDIACEECEQDFQLCAISNGGQYEFFAS